MILDQDRSLLDRLGDMRKMCKSLEPFDFQSTDDEIGVLKSSVVTTNSN